MRHSLMLLALLVAPALAGAVSVNGVPIAQDRIEEAVQSMKAQGAKDSPELRDMIVRKLIENEIMIQEAVKRGIDKQPAFKEELNDAREQILARLMVAEWAKANPVSDKELQAEYERLKTAMTGQEYSVRHIMLETEAEAKAIIASLAKGAKFETLAKQKSKDKGSAERGGNMGWVHVRQAAPPLAEGMKALGKGQYSKVPVKSDRAWHVLKVDDVREAKVPSFAEARNELTRQIQAQRFNAYLQKLMSEAKIQK